jgi:hypothetical protein
MASSLSTLAIFTNTSREEVRNKSILHTSRLVEAPLLRGNERSYR